MLTKRWSVTKFALRSTERLHSFISLFYLQQKGWSNSSLLSFTFTNPTTMTITRSLAIILLFSTQMISAMSMFLWLVLLSFITKSNEHYSFSGNLFLLYPAFPLAFSLYAWLCFRKKNYSRAVFFSSIPAVASFGLMTYYFIIGSVR